MSTTSPPRTRRLYALGAIAVAAAGAAALIEPRDPASDDARAPEPRRSAASAPGPSPGGAARLPQLDQLRQAQTQPAPTDVFAGRSWEIPKPPPAPAPVAAPPPPAPVQAPPLPFVYLGKWAEQGKVTVYYLERGPKLIHAKAGDRLDEHYQLEGHQGADLVFTYLPLQTRQSIRIGE